MLDEIKDGSIVICNNSYKDKVLKNVKKLINIKFMSMSEFIKSLYFDYDEKAILYVIKKYKVKYDIARYYLDNLIYILEPSYDQDKMNFLLNLKKELINNNLLIFNTRFKNYIKDKKIVIYNYSLSNFEKYLLKDINYIEINDIEGSSDPLIYEFSDIEEEVEFVAYKISELINSGVDIHNIKLTNIDSSYINVINKIFNFYNLKIDKFNNIPILSSIIGNLFYTNLDNGIESAINSIDDYKETDTYNKIINICNKYVWCDDVTDLKVLIYNDLKHTYIENIKYTNMIQVCDYESSFSNDDYVFMLGFNQGIIPRTYKDEDFINDDIKPSYIDNTIEKNIRSKEITLKAIRSIKNLTITYKLKSHFNTYYPSNLVDELGEVKRVSLGYKKSFSDISNEIKLSKLLDDLIKFNHHPDLLDLLYNNYSIPYNTYSNKFTGIDKCNFNDFIKHKKEFNLSYSTMDDYNKCAFRFYIEKILYLKDNIDKFSVTLGNIYHDVLEKSTKGCIDVKDEVYKYLTDNNINLSNSNKFFVNRAIDNIKYLLDVIDEQNKFSKLDKIETEKYVKVKIKDNINFIGFIDKIVYNIFNDTIIASIIDYKTYIKKPSLKYIDYGIGLQLPVYMYLASKSYKNIKFAGFYLQNITLDNKSDEEKKKSLKLIGFTNSAKDILEKFDYNYMDSTVIDGIKINKDGSFSSNSMKHMLSDEDILDIIEKTREKIDETINNILDAKFDINPKFDKENIGCEFCKFNDICFRRDSDFVNITPSTDDEF